MSESRKESNRNSQERFRKKQRLEEYGPGAGTDIGIAAWEEYSAAYRVAQEELKEVRARAYEAIRVAKAKYVRIVTAENNRLGESDK